MNVLFVGDVVGRPGRQILAAELERLIDRYRIDYTVVNVENAAGGFGVTAEVLEELRRLPIDCMTTGNHVWDKKEALTLLDAEARLLRPANYPKGNPGRGVYVSETTSGIPVATLNLEGQVFMRDLSSPFETALQLLESLPPDVKVILVDFHAEATSEKQALGWFLDGRVSAVFGTHTHVPTADARILPRRTAFVTDVGMTGAYEGVIGFRADRILQRFLLQTPVAFEVATRDVRLAAAVVEIDEASGQSRSIESVLVSARKDRTAHEQARALP